VIRLCGLANVHQTPIFSASAWLIG
jgi:hypothetical protein